MERNHTMKLRGFLINLERNGLRLEKAAKQLAALGIDFERFPAVDGRADRLAPARISSIVAPTGTSAHGPGNLVDSENVTTLAMMPTRPAHETAATSDLA